MPLFLVPLFAAPMLAGSAITTAVDEQEDPQDIIVQGDIAKDGQSKVVANGALGDKALIDTPYSVTVVDKDDIARRQANSIGQIFADDPSVYSSAPSATTNWWGTQIRGLGVRNYYIHDVPLLLYWGGDFPLEPIQSVTALKGLTGFMYGFGAPGGVISYRTKRPTAAPLLTTDFGYRTTGVFYARLDAGGPLTQDGKLGYRLNLGRETGTAYNGTGVNRFVGSLALDYRFDPNVRWYANATYEDSKLAHEPFQIYWANYADAELPRPTYDYAALNIANSFYKTRTLAAATGIEWSFATDWLVKLTYGYTAKLHNSNKMFVYLQNIAGDYTGAAYNFAELDRNHFAQAMIQGQLVTGPLRHEIVVGTALQNDPSKFGLDDYHWGMDFSGNIYRRQPFRVTRTIRFGTDGMPGEDRQRAVFASDTLHLGDHVQAMLGLRYTRYRLFDLDTDPADSGYRATALTPTLAMIYKPTPHASLYASYVEAMEPGSRVGGEYVNVGEVLKATISRQYEVGAKYDHNAFGLTAAAFRIMRGATIDREIEGGRRRLTQDGLTVYKGIEAIARYRPNTDLKLGIGVIRLDPEIRTVSSDNMDLRGHIPGGAAKWQWVANADYHPAAVPGLSFHGNVRYTGAAPTNDDNTVYVDRYTVVSGGLQYRTPISGRQVTFTGNVNNVLNARYWTQTNVGEAINGALSASVSW